MKKICFLLIAFLASITQTSAADNILGISNSRLREGNIHADDIPGIISSAINFFMSIAGTIAVIFIIIGAYKILFGSLQQDKTKWKDTIIMALGWFALAALAWMIIKVIVDNFT